MSSTWADQPWALIPTPKTTEEVCTRRESRCFRWNYRIDMAQSPHAAVVLAQEMCQAHNAFIRGLNSIYLQCHLIKEKQDIEDFLYFAATWAHIIDEHHNIEETIMFPSYEILAKKPGLLSHAADQHHAFRQGLLDVQDYCKQTKAEDYDSQKLKGIIDSFADQLYEHLHEELDMLPSLAEYTDSLELARVTDEVTQQAMKKAKVRDNDCALPLIRLLLC